LRGATLIPSDLVAQEKNAMNRSVLFVAFVTHAFFLSGGSVLAEDMKGMAMTTRPVATPAGRAFAASMKTMMTSMNVKPTGKPDKNFALMMVPHHQGAIDMAKVELQYGTDPELRQLATDIVAAQDKEIAQMKAWLERNGR
jgi:uncharacterized protein (DUF305 family)